MAKTLISRETLSALGKVYPREFIYDPLETIITPEAVEFADSRGIRLVPREKHQQALAADGSVTVALGSDHGGFPLKVYLKQRLTESGFKVEDVGTFSNDAVDYPDFARKVAEEVSSGRAQRGVMVDSIGVASGMVANKVAHVRAAACQVLPAVVSARRHNDANVLTLGGKLVSDAEAWDMVETFLREPFDGGRHLPRVIKINQLD